MDKQVCPLRSPYAVVALSHNLAVVFRHLEEVGNLHAALVTFFTTADRHDAIGNFLLADDEEKSANEALPEKIILKIVDVRDNFFVE